MANQWHHYPKYWSGHAAIDIGAWTGAPVKSSDAGYVVEAGRGWSSGYGSHVVIDHGNGYRTLYAHLNSIFVSPGENEPRANRLARWEIRRVTTRRPGTPL
ncbi:MAG: M23 family metallopeptidase [Caldilineaceae bacterium]